MKPGSYQCLIKTSDKTLCEELGLYMSTSKPFKQNLKEVLYFFTKTFVLQFNVIFACEYKFSHFQYTWFLASTFGCLAQSKTILSRSKNMPVITHTAQNNINSRTQTGHTANQSLSAVAHDRGQQANYTCIHNQYGIHSNCTWKATYYTVFSRLDAPLFSSRPNSSLPEIQHYMQ